MGISRRRTPALAIEKGGICGIAAQKRGSMTKPALKGKAEREEGQRPNVPVPAAKGLKGKAERGGAGAKPSSVLAAEGPRNKAEIGGAKPAVLARMRKGHLNLGGGETKRHCRWA